MRRMRWIGPLGFALFPRWGVGAWEVYLRPKRWNAVQTWRLGPLIVATRAREPFRP